MWTGNHSTLQKASDNFRQKDSRQKQREVYIKTSGLRRLLRCHIEVFLPHHQSVRTHVTSYHLGRYKGGNRGATHPGPRLSQGVPRLPELTSGLERINCLVAVKSGSSELRIAPDHTQSHQLFWCTPILGLCVCVCVEANICSQGFTCCLIKVQDYLQHRFICQIFCCFIVQSTRCSRKS